VLFGNLVYELILHDFVIVFCLILLYMTIVFLMRYSYWSSRLKLNQDQSKYRYDYKCGLGFGTTIIDLFREIRWVVHKLVNRLIINFCRLD